MSLTTFAFFCLVAATTVIYYIVPCKFRWVVLLAVSGYFIYQSDTRAMVGVMAITALIAYVAALLIENFKKKEKQSTARLIATIAVIAIAVCMLTLKDSGFFVNIYNQITSANAAGLAIAAPIGISYYSLTWIGYVLDVYWGTCPVEKNPFKFALFAGYFPLLTSGPIVKYQEYGEEITNGHKFDYTGVCFGLQRMVWGLMKKLIISERAATLVNTIYGDPVTYAGAYVFLAMFLFVIQLYTDFSGCIDIALGVSQIFGIKLPENFDTPFLSKNLSEFWRKWHITLGGWLRDYIFYPIIKSAPFQALGKKTKKAFSPKLGKKFGKNVPVWIALMITWFLIGFWHGGAWNYIWGVGLFYGILIVLGEMTHPIWEKFMKLIHWNPDGVSFKTFQVIRTVVLFAFGLSFFRAYDGFGQGVQIWKAALSTWNPEVLFNGSLLTLGLDLPDMIVFAVFFALIVVAGVVRYVTGKEIRVIVAGWNIVIRWILYLALFYSVVIFGCYGSGYDASAFIYQQF